MAAIFVILGLIVYFFPAALALHRNCKAEAGIVILNLFLGWTFVGWVMALVWAASGEKMRAARVQVNPATAAQEFAKADAQSWDVS